MEVKQNSNFDGDWDAQCTYCGRPHREHIWTEHPDPNYKHRMPCEAEKAAIVQNHRQMVLTGKGIIFVGWILVPLLIAVVGFASVWVGILLFVISLIQIGWKAVELYGDPEKWFPGYKERKDKKRRMAHYFYHCERNPKGFERLKTENFRERAAKE